MIISLIVAAAKNNGICKNGKMLLHLSNDMKHFKNITWGLPIVMGRKTFESLGKALPGRKNIVVTRQADWTAEGATVVSSIEKALQAATATDAREIMIIGGGEIYKALFDKAHRIYLTRVDAEPEADTFFPDIQQNEWELKSRQDYQADEKNEFNYAFQTWERI